MDKFIQDLVKEAGTLVLRGFGKERATHSKSSYISDAVTKADLRSEKLMISRIREKYPDHGILAEESGGFNELADYLWILDPIDGTLNYSSGIPMFGVMACVAHRGVVKISAIYLPATGELYFAKAGKGAYLNGKRIRASMQPSLDHSKGCGSGSFRGRFLKFFKNLLNVADGKDIVFGSQGAISVNSCYTACGRRDWMVALIGAIHDFAPTSLLLEEAGCSVTGADGKTWTLDTPGLIAANPKLHKELMTLTKKI